jgi:alanine-synthesizing transaminase
VFATRTNWDFHQNRLAAAIDAARSNGETLLDLTASNPTTVGIEYPEREILEALSQSSALHYEPAAKGLLSAREAVACYYGELGTLISPQDLVLTVSTSEAYSYCFRLLCNPGDEVLVPSPSYPLFDFLADIQDVKLVPYELVYDHGWQIEFESLRRGISDRTRAIMIVHPNNPTGHYTRQWEIDCLNAVCRHHELALIVDEVFLDYSLEISRPTTFAANKGALTFTLSGLSKISGLPQMKSAWIAISGPDALAREADTRLEMIADTYLSPNAPIQGAMPVMLEARRGVHQQLIARVRQNLGVLDRIMATVPGCSRLTFDAGWYAVLRVPVTRTDEELVVELLQREKVLIHPGLFFDFPGDGYLVISLITPTDEFREGIARLAAFLVSPAESQTAQRVSR